MPTANTNGIRLEYETFGRPRDPTVVLVMGFATPMLGWDEAFCQKLAGRGYHVVRFDNRDVGLSSKIEGGPAPNLQAALSGDRSVVAYSLMDMAADTVGLLDALDVSAAHIVGVSMGGMIAQCMAIHHPSRVRSLASIMSTTGDPTVGQASPGAFGALLSPTPSERAAYIDRYVANWRVLGSPDYPTDEAVLRARGGRSYDRCFYPIGVARQLMAIVTAGDRTADLARVTAPTVVIHGTADPLIHHDGGEATARAIPNARMVSIEGMGHDLPEALWPRLIDAIVDNASHA